MSQPPTPQQIEVLFVEDSEFDVELAVRALSKEGLQPNWRVVATEASLRRELDARAPQVILSDFSMPEFNGLAALGVARQIAPHIPFIFLSGTIGEERAIEAIRSGATDYVLKDNTRRLGTAVRRALAEVEERKAYEARIRYLANYDGLSHLPNRSLLADRAAQAIAHARRSGRTCALVVLNVDRFKRVNEAYGQAAGDALLKGVAARLGSALREGDTAARLGADSFAVLATNLARPEDAMGFARQLQELVAQPFAHDGRELHATLSVGASTFPRDGEEFELLLRNAETAMQRVKAAGGNAFQFYAAAMTREAGERVALEDALRVALERRQLALHYQPQVEIAHGRIAGVEALMRWHHPERGMVPPGQFIPIAEESSLICTLGEWALYEGCRQLAAWDSAGLAPVRLAVNVSARQFREPGFAATVQRAVREHRLDPSRLELEITEGLLIEDREQALALLNELKALGVLIAVDDFGTGYSSLSYLSGLPVDCLKIDRAFVMKVSAGGRDAAIAQAIISLAHALSLRVLAEGVETAAQSEFLKAHGCDEAQGYFYAKPASAADTAAKLKR
jgi:diguanylate cyclase (GGDEF)-like protein